MRRAAPNTGSAAPSSKAAAFSTEWIVRSAGIENQIAAAETVEVNRDGSFQGSALERDVEIEIEMANAHPIRAGPRVDIHNFHDRIQ